MDEERRKSRRKRVVLEVIYKEPPGLEPDYLTNLSEGGLFISTNESFFVGQTISFDIVSPKLSDPLGMQGVIRWRRVADIESSGGIGVEFVYDDDAAQEAALEALGKVIRRKKKAIA